MKVPKSGTSSNSEDSERDCLLTQRTALIFLLAVLAAATVSSVLLLGGYTPAQGALGGLGALAGAVKFFHWLIS
jgi:membrane associated rhomboid family serine protease